jgi:surfactin synthase thioesterase subunit
MIPGLGADRRVLERLHITIDEVVYIDWLTPQPIESLADYCQRLIIHCAIEKGQTIIGLSFGGIVAQEIAALTQARHLFIISSVKSRTELPLLFRLVARLRLYKLFPLGIVKSVSWPLWYAFAPMSREDFKMLKQIVADTDIAFIQWAIPTILHWQGSAYTGTCLHIHGSHDRIFSCSGFKNCLVISKGGHFMIVNRAEEVSQLINQHLSASSDLDQATIA